MNPLFQIPEDISALGADDLRTFINETVPRAQEVGGDPHSFAVEGRTLADVGTELRGAVDALSEARERLAALEAEGIEGAEGTEGTEGDEAAAEGDEGAEGAEEPEEGAEGDEAAEGDEGELSAEIAELANAVGDVVETPSVTAAAVPRPRRAPARARSARPTETEEPRIALVAAANVDGVDEGQPFPDALTIADSMIRRRNRFGNIAEGAVENVPIARASWSHLYGAERTLGRDEVANAALIASVTDEAQIRTNFEARRKQAGGSLVASGGLCAPVTPYYQLMMISGAQRPVRAALPSFNADRGGIRAALPASLAAVTTGVGSMTAAQDAAGGTAGTKSCQAIDCPPFVETDVEIIYHCLKFGNLGARTFPERVAQWNNLVLAAHARLAERILLTGIDAASTQVTAASLGLGATADLLGEILVAAAALRSRHRMDPEAVLRVMLPQWVLDLVVSDVYRSQFGRWDMTRDKFVGLLREGNVEPSFYIDSAIGKNQEFGTQNAGALLPFPSTVTWYLFPEGSFIYLDGGTLELGLVRDSVLNATNDFEIFGESFENVAFIGVESLAVTSTVCDSGITAGTHNVLCPIDYTHTS